MTKNKIMTNQLTRLQQQFVLPTVPAISRPLECGEVRVDLSKHLLSKEVITVFSEQLAQKQFALRRSELFAGMHVNSTESRPALHTALRNMRNQGLVVDGLEVNAAIDQLHAKMAAIVDTVLGAGDQHLAGSIRHVLHIGMGGSGLGPALCHEALQEYQRTDIDVTFLSSLETQTITRILEKLNPHKTLCIVVSKSFASEEVLFIAGLVQQWLQQAGVVYQRHMLAITQATARAQQWGIDAACILPIWSWVGGRFSVWSAVSLSLALAIGMDNFKLFLQGAFVADQHFCQAPFAENIPIQLAMLSIWYSQYWGRQTHAILPYASGLGLLPSYLQQLHMESLGKHLTRTGQAIEAMACPVIFGGVGNETEHAMAQYFMQAPDFVPLDLLVISPGALACQARRWLHAMVQSQVLWEGYQDSQNAFKNIMPHHPHSLITLTQLSPTALGTLLALYEHKVFVLACWYEINAFDQWGVERAKALITSL